MATELAKYQEQLDKATIAARVDTHGGERRKGLWSSRLIKTLGGVALLGGAAALSTGIIFASVFTTTATTLALIAGGSAGVAWGLPTFITGSIKGYLNKHSRA